MSASRVQIVGDPKDHSSTEMIKEVYDRQNAENVGPEAPFTTS